MKLRPGEICVTCPRPHNHGWQGQDSDPRRLEFLFQFINKMPPALIQVNSHCVSRFMTCLAHFPGRLSAFISGILCKL